MPKNRMQKTMTTHPDPESAMTEREEKETEIRFEAAVSRLEQIVESLERGEPDLAAALAKYETGVRLLTQSYGLLERADRAVALLAGVDEQGKPVTAPFDATAAVEREASPGSSRGSDRKANQPRRRGGRGEAEREIETETEN
jgi:exodeoxyribonuclease VII small subunit